MSMPANLFVDTPEMEDESLHHLGNDVEAWPEEIITKLKERLPASAGPSSLVLTTAWWWRCAIRKTPNSLSSGCRCLNWPP